MSKRLTMPRMNPKIACMLLLQYAEINWIPNDVRSAINSVVEEIRKGPLRDDEIERIYKQGVTDCLNGIVADLEETLFGKEGEEETIQSRRER